MKAQWRGHHSMVGLAVLTLAFATTACSTDDTELSKLKDPSVVQEFLTAEDFDEISEDPAALCLEGSVNLDFSEPGKSYGFQFAAAAGDILSVSTAPNPDMDTVVLLYGPADDAGYFGEFPIQADDDSGPGLLSSIGAYEVKTTGLYMVVVTTYAGAFKGNVNLTVAINGAVGCGETDPPAPEDVCCVFGTASGVPGASVVLPADLCEAEGGMSAPIDECSDPAPEEVCCLVGTPFFGIDSFITTEEQCNEIGGEPAPKDECTDPTPEEICCILADPATGITEAFITVEEECNAVGGSPAPKEECIDPEPVEVCCLFPTPTGEPGTTATSKEECEALGGEVVDDEACSEPFPEEVCCVFGFAGEKAIVSIDECISFGGAPLPTEECFEEPEPVCCLFFAAGGVEKAEGLTLDECIAEGGAPAPLDECDGGGGGEEVCCSFGDVSEILPEEICLSVGGMPSDKNNCLEPELVCCYIFTPSGEVLKLADTPIDACIAEGGEPAPNDECKDDPVELVCCLLLNVGDIGIVPVDECNGAGGIPLPDDACTDDPPPEVCCIFVDADGSVSKTPVALGEICIEEGGEPAPIDECFEPPVEICCGWGDPATGGAGEYGYTTAEECEDSGGFEADAFKCEPDPGNVCCFIGELAAVGIGPLFFASADECAEYSGTVQPDAICEDPNAEVCCVVLSPLGFLPVEGFTASAYECLINGGAIGNDELCEEPEPNVCCQFFTGATATVPEDVCFAEGGFPAPDEVCEPTNEEICCFYAGADGAVDQFIASAADCEAEGGSVQSKELCSVDNPICCELITETSPLGPVFLSYEILGIGECLDMGGDDAAWSHCIDVVDPPAEVCCSLTVPGTIFPVEFWVTDEAECAAAGGTANGVDMCEGLEEIVCCLFPTDAASPMEPPYGTTLSKYECLVSGGAAEPKEVCYEPVEEICCYNSLIFGPLNKWITSPGSCEETGGEIVPKNECAPTGDFICCALEYAGGMVHGSTTPDICESVGGSIESDTKCGADVPVEPVCCGFFSSAGGVSLEITDQIACEAGAGEVLPYDECIDDPALCCVWVNADGTEKVDFISEADCADLSGEVLSDAECIDPTPVEPVPVGVCCAFEFPGIPTFYESVDSLGTCLKEGGFIVDNEACE